MMDWSPETGSIRHLWTGLDTINLDEVDENQDAYLEELIQFLLGWLTNHIKLVDKKNPGGISSFKAEV